MAGFYIFVLSLFVVPYAIAAVTPTWRWLLGVTLVIGGAIAALWIQDWIVTSTSGYHEGVGGALGRAMFAFVTLGFFAGVAIRAATLVLSARGVRPGYCFAICVFGAAIIPSFFAAAAAWDTWQRRLPSDDCLKATFSTKVANAEFAIPAASFFVMYLGSRSSQDAYYFDLNPYLRAFCALSDDGRQPVKATLIGLRFDKYMNSPPAICTGMVADWAKTYCAAHGSATGQHDDSVAFPLHINIFAPDEFAFGEFGGSRSTYADSLVPKNWPAAPVYFQTDASTPDRQPLTFECNENGNDLWCKTSYPWKDGANLNYTFRARRDDVAEKGKRIDVEARKFLSGFQPSP